MEDQSNPQAACLGDDITTHDARDLIPNGVKAHIVLNGQTYTLRITRAAKLILMK